MSVEGCPEGFVDTAVKRMFGDATLLEYAATMGKTKYLEVKRVSLMTARRQKMEFF